MNACCPYCGAEYLLAEARCWDCKLALTEPPEPTLPVDDPADEVGYELDDWPAAARSTLTASLAEHAVPTRWEPGLTLVVREADAGAVDDVLDRLDEEDWPDEDAGDDSGEGAHTAMSDLFVAVDRLMHEPWNEGIGAEVVEVEARVASSPPPFGIEQTSWGQIQALAAAVVRRLDAGVADEAVVADATTLRDTLRPYV